MSETPDTGTQDDKIGRQIERITDSLKRLFAVIIGFSFQQAATGVYDTLSPIAMYSTFTWGNSLIAIAECLCFCSLFITMLVYYYHTDRHFDQIYIHNPGKNISPKRFLLEFVSVTLTMPPFLFAAYTLIPSKLTHAITFGWFFSASILLMVWGSLILVVTIIIKMIYESGEPRTDETELNHDTNALFWIIWDCSVALLLIGTAALSLSVFKYAIFSNIGVICVMAIFLAARSGVDILLSWPTKYPGTVGVSNDVHHRLQGLKSNYAKPGPARILIIIVCLILVIVTSVVFAWFLYCNSKKLTEQTVTIPVTMDRMTRDNSITPNDQHPPSVRPVLYDTTTSNLAAPPTATSYPAAPTVPPATPASAASTTLSTATATTMIFGSIIYAPTPLSAAPLQVPAAAPAKNAPPSTEKLPPQ